MSVDMFLVLGGIFFLLWVALELALTHGRSLVMLVFTLGIIGLFIAYQSAQAADELAPVALQSFAGIELHSQEEADKLADEIEKELQKKD